MEKAGKSPGQKKRKRKRTESNSRNQWTQKMSKDNVSEAQGPPQKKKRHYSIENWEKAATDSSLVVVEKKRRKKRRRRRKSLCGPAATPSPSVRTGGEAGGSGLPAAPTKRTFSMTESVEQLRLLMQGRGEKAQAVAVKKEEEEEDCPPSERGTQAGEGKNEKCSTTCGIPGEIRPKKKKKKKKKRQTEKAREVKEEAEQHERCNKALLDKVLRFQISLILNEITVGHCQKPPPSKINTRD